MATIEHISDGEDAVLVRNKLNAAIDEANAVDNKFDLINNTLDDIQNGSNSVSTENNFTDAYKAILDAITNTGSGQIITAAERSKLASIEGGAQVNTINDVIEGTNISIDKTDPLNPIISLSSEIGGAIRVIGYWNASTNTPNLSSLTLDQGEAYQVSVSGSTSLNGETNWKAKDLVVWDDMLSGNWFKIDNTDDVLSVAGKTGAVTLVKADVGLDQVDNTSDLNKPISTATQTALNAKLNKYIVKTETDFTNALLNTGDIVIFVNSNSLNLTGNFNMNCDSVSITGTSQLTVAGNTTFTHLSGGAAVIDMNIDGTLLWEGNYSLGFSSSVAKTLRINVNGLGTYNQNTPEYTATFTESGSGNLTVNYTNRHENLTISASGITVTKHPMQESSYIQTLTSESIIVDEPSVTDANTWNIEMPFTPYSIEYIDNAALSSTDNFDCYTELGAAQDTSLHTITSVDPNTGYIYTAFRVGDNHLPNLNMESIIRYSKDGANTWTGLDDIATHTVVPDKFSPNIADLTGMIITPTGRIVLFMRVYSSGLSIVAFQNIYSDDRGATWSNPVTAFPEDSAQVASGSYFWDSRYCIGRKGEMIIAKHSNPTSEGSTTRRTRLYSSTDGVSWYRYSILQEQTDGIYNFDEYVLRDFGNGVFVAVNRIVANVSDGTYPSTAISISKDYGKTFTADGSILEPNDYLTSAWDPTQNHASYIYLEDLVSGLNPTGTGTALENTLCWLDRIDYNGRKWMFILYYIRYKDDPTTPIDRYKRLKFQVIDLDDFLLNGNNAIRPSLATTVYTALGAYDGTNTTANDGNGSCFLASSKFGSNVIFTLTDQQVSTRYFVVTGRILWTTIQTQMDAYDAAPRNANS